MFLKVTCVNSAFPKETYVSGDVSSQTKHALVTMYDTFWNLHRH